MPGQWSTLTPREIVEYFQTDLNNGLSDKEARQRLSKFGPNQLSNTPPVLFGQLFFKQFKSIIFLALLAATVVSMVFCAPADYSVMLVMVLLAALFGSMLEYRMEHSMIKLRRLSALKATVRRNGQERIVPAVELVPGDIVLLAAGDLVPADMRLLETFQLAVDESVLTGKSTPVMKKQETQPAADLTREDALNMAYMNTVVTQGRGLGLVVHTGLTTELGFPAGVSRTDEHEQTPLPRRLAWYGDGPAAFCLITCAVAVAAGIMKGGETAQMGLAALSLAVAAVPVGLPAVVTAALQAGVLRMSKRGAVIRKPWAVQALGGITVLCANKAKIFTTNELTVRKIVVGGNTFTVTGKGYDPKGEFTGTGDKPAPGHVFLMKTAALCNNAILKRGSINITGIFRGLTGRRPVHEWSVTGGATEGALLVMAAKAGYWRERLELTEHRVAEIPFTPERRLMTVVYQKPAGTLTAYVKGAPEVLLTLCTHSDQNGKISPLSAHDREELMAQHDFMAQEGMRVLAFAYRELPAGTKVFSETSVEEQLIFLGLAGMSAPLKPTAVKTVQTCRRAGIKVVTLTGDHPLTARAQARELGLIPPEKTEEKGNLLTGYDLDLMSAAQLKQRTGAVSLYARVTPRHKQQVIDALKQSGHIVAVTGSGIKDAAAVKEADIGIAMGVSGAGVTKEAADVILAEDQFASIVAAVGEGRGIAHNIRKAIRYLLTCAAGGMAGILPAVLAGLPLPLIPVQILWANLISSGLPAAALSVAPCDRALMMRPPRQTKGSFGGRGTVRRIITDGTVIGLSTLLAFIAGLSPGETAPARTMAFNTLILSQLLFVFTNRYDYTHSLETGPRHNPYLVGAVLISGVLQATINFMPSLQAHFHLVDLSLIQWACVCSVALIPAIWGTLFHRMASKLGKKIMYLRVRLG